MDGEEVQEEELGYVPVRPYSAEMSAADQAPQRPARYFRPRAPGEAQPLPRESTGLSSSSCDLTAEAMLQDAWRRQEYEDNVRGKPSFKVNERFQGMSLTKFGVDSCGSRLAALGASSSSSGAPRQLKEWKEGRSMELMDLAFSSATKMVNGQVRSCYAPISVPYYASVSAEDSEAAADKEGGGAPPAKSRPSLKLVDEQNANAAKELFLDDAGELLEDQVFLLQMPAILPSLLDPEEEVKRDDVGGQTSGPGSNISRLPDGRLGKLRIHKSGKVVMDIGGLPFCVNQGSDTFFSQDLACVCPLANEMISLGRISKRMVVSPDVDAMLEMAEGDGPPEEGS